MRIYEIVTEYKEGKDHPIRITYGRFRVACETFSEALRVAETKIKNTLLEIASIEIIADTRV